MATYKVIQDIEAEDKLLGPLTFRQFIYGGICAIFLYISFLTITKGVGFLAILFAPPGLVCGFFAWPWGRDQPTEVWALAKVRFLFKPRKRLWDQNGAKELVTVTAPKKVEVDYTNGLSENEVQSRLSALANTIDSRGWAIKNVNVNLYSQPSQITSDLNSDRLISLSNIPQVNTTSLGDDDVHAADDMLDEQNNAQAQRVDNMITASTRAHRQQLINQLEQPAPAPTPAPQPTAAAPNAPANYWFMNQPAASAPAGSAMFQPQIVTAASQPQPAAAATPVANEAETEAALIQSLKNQDKAQAGANVYGHLHTLRPLSAAGANPQATQPQNPQPAPAVQPVTPKPNAAILDLAQNDNFNVATIAREAQKRTEPQEVVISLH
ncbi:MAG TPA: PrgI family protein [Candidatus Saccharimonadales bacterium]